MGVRRMFCVLIKEIKASPRMCPGARRAVGVLRVTCLPELVGRRCHNFHVLRSPHPPPPLAIVTPLPFPSDGEASRTDWVFFVVVAASSPPLLAPASSSSCGARVRQERGHRTTAERSPAQVHSAKIWGEHPEAGTWTCAPAWAAGRHLQPAWHWEAPTPSLL